MSTAFHYFVYLVLGTGFLAACYMVFVVFKPPSDGSVAPLFGKAKELPSDFFLRRRLYAIEAWITFAALAIYFALTDYRGP